MFVSRTLLANLKSVHLAVLRPYPPHHYRQHFSLSPRPQAAESPDSFLATFEHTALFRKLADKPDALSALTDFAKLLQTQGRILIILTLHVCVIHGFAYIVGVDIMSGTPPSMRQMFRMAGNPEFREAAKRVAEELHKAGIEMNSQVCCREIHLVEISFTPSRSRLWQN